jgi:hypothetical protein
MHHDAAEAEPPAAWIRGFGVASLLLTALALAYWWKLEQVLGWFRDFYGPGGSWFGQLLNTRLRGYSRFAVLVVAASAVWLLCLRWAPLLNAKTARLSQALGDRAGVLALAGGSVMAALAFYFSDGQWRYFGCPCWDNYCAFAELIGSWLAARTPDAAGQLVAFMRTDYHSNSPLVPLVVSLVHLATGLSVVTSYRLAVGLATLGALVIVWRALLMLDVDARSRPALMVLLGSNPVVVRCAFFPQTDPFMLLWITALWFLGLKRLTEPRPILHVGCFLLICTGLVVKLSFLPALVLLPGWTLASILWARLGHGGTGRPAGVLVADERRPWARLAADTVMFGVVPLLVFAAYQQAFGLWPLYRVELRSMWTPDTFFPFKVMSLLHAGAFFLVLLTVGWNRFLAVDRLLLGWLVLYLLSLWISPASGWDRFYLPLVPIFCVTAGRGMSRLIEGAGLAPAWVFVFLAAILNYSILALKLYI